jgi:hypothetical protein
MVARMSQFEQKIAIVGEKNQTFTISIQAPDRTQHRLTADVHQIRDHLPSMTVRIGARRDNPLRLIHRQVIAFQRRANRAAVKQDFVEFWVHFRAEFRDDLSINPYPALGDPRLARSPRADSGGGEHFLKPFLHKLSFPQLIARAEQSTRR